MSKKASESWLKDHENAEKLVQAISLDMNERSKYPRSSSNFTKMTGAIRNSIVKLSANISDLSRNLDECSRNNLLTSLEKNRRITMVNQLKISLKQFEENLRDESAAKKDQLISFASDDINQELDNNNELFSYSSDQLQAQQDRILHEQDRGIETLSHIVSNQKNIAQSIGREVDRQNVMIDSMEGKMDQINDRLVRETKRIRFFDRKSSTCGIWMLIVLLFILIIVIAAIPKH